MQEQERPTVRYIPENYTVGISVMGMHFSTRKFIEGIVLGVIMTVLAFSVFGFVRFIDAGTRIGLIISFALTGMAAGVIGINDEPVSVFAENWFRYRQKRRMAFYNPHIKTRDEDLSIPYVYRYREEREALPKEKIIAFYRRYRANLEKSEMKRMAEFQKTDTYNETAMFFKDDEGFFVKPVEYMSGPEYRKYQKELKKEARRRKKEEKRQAKLEAKQRRIEEREVRKASGRRFF